MSSIKALEALKTLIEIKSEQGDASSGAPFGLECRRALDTFLRMGEDMGFKSYNADGYAGHLEYGEGDAVVGVLAHLDVVPAGSGWSSPPYKPTVKDGKVYGRGAMDDKGPLIAALFALKEIKDEREKSGIPLGARVRIIAGTNEENGSECIAYYKTKQKMPDVAFSPDADFPVINCEKTLYGCKLVLEMTEPLKSHLLYIEGGKAHNAVPDYAECGITEFEGADKFRASLNKDVTLERASGGYKLSAAGKSAHSLECELGDNAALKLVRALLQEHSPLCGDKTLGWIIDRLDNNTRGEGLGVSFTDEISGDMRVNFVRIGNNDSSLELQLDMRVPISVSPEALEEKIKQALPSGATMVRERFAPYLFVPKDSFLVSTLLRVYSDCTGEKDPQPIVTGGGTYARTMDNCVAFGATFKGKRHNIHSADEFIEIETLEQLIKIYKRAIEQLAEGIAK